MNHELWSSSQYNDKLKKPITKWANHKCSVDVTTRVGAREMPALRSGGTKTGPVVQNLRTL